MKLPAFSVNDALKSEFPKRLVGIFFAEEWKERKTGNLALPSINREVNKQLFTGLARFRFKHNG